MTQRNPFGASAFSLGRHAGTGPPISLSRLSLREAERLGAVFAAMDPWARYPYQAAALAAYLCGEEPGAPRFALQLGAEIVGAVGLRLNWLRGPYLQFLGIAPPHWGRGIGSAVLIWLEQQARAGGDRNLWVCASDFNARAIAFYEHHGFQLVAPLEGLVRDDHTEVLLRKRLA